MCRIVAVSGGDKNLFVDYLNRQKAGQEDGTGYSFVRTVNGNREFFVKKSGQKFDDLVGTEFFNDLTAEPGWKLGHMRNGTQGERNDVNAHPFHFGQYVTAHNGGWGPCIGFKPLLSVMGIKINGKTDSEIAAAVISKIGPDKYYKNIGEGGVLVSLQLDGTLWVVVTSGNVLYKSTVNYNNTNLTMLTTDNVTGSGEKLGYGWYHFGTDGALVTSFVEPASYKDAFPNIERDIVNYTKTLVADLWGYKVDKTDANRAILFNEWLDKASRFYGITKPLFEFSPQRPAYEVTGGGEYVQATNTIKLYKKFSLLTLLHEFRHAWECQRQNGQTSEETARGWSCSLYYTADSDRYIRGIKRGLFKFY